MENQQQKRVKLDSSNTLANVKSERSDEAMILSTLWNDFHNISSIRRKAFEKQIVEFCKSINQMFNLIMSQTPRNRQNMTFGELCGGSCEMPSFDAEMDQIISGAIALATNNQKVLSKDAAAPTGVHNGKPMKRKRNQGKDDSTSNSNIVHSDKRSKTLKRCQMQKPKLYASTSRTKTSNRKYSLHRTPTPAVTRAGLQKKILQSCGSGSANQRIIKQDEICRLFSKQGTPLTLHERQPAIIIPSNSAGDMLTVSDKTDLNSLPYYAVIALKSMINKLSDWMARAVPPINVDEP